MALLLEEVTVTLPEADIHLEGVMALEGVTDVDTMRNMRAVVDTKDVVIMRAVVATKDAADTNLAVEDMRDAVATEDTVERTKDAVAMKEVMPTETTEAAGQGRRTTTEAKDMEKNATTVISLHTNATFNHAVTTTTNHITTIPNVNL